MTWHDNTVQFQHLKKTELGRIFLILFCLSLSARLKQQGTREQFSYNEVQQQSVTIGAHATLDMLHWTEEHVTPGTVCETECQPFIDDLETA